MGRLRTAIVALVVAVVALLPVAGAATAQLDGGDDGAPEPGPDDPRKENVEYEWWNEDWHMRVPVLVRPKYPDAVIPDREPVIDGHLDVPVKAEIDFTQVIREVGDSPQTRWPQTFRSLNSFTFDKDSVRVVEYNREKGTIKSGPDNDPVVPSTFLPSHLTKNSGTFDPSRNAIGTVTWIAEDEVQNPRLYFVYFDIKENGDKPPADPSPEEKGALDSLYWIRPGTDVYGYVPSDDTQSSSSRPTVTVYGLHDDTAVRFGRYSTQQPGFPPKPVEACENSDADICVKGGRILEGLDTPAFEIEGIGGEDSGDTSITVDSPTKTPYFFRVTADKPVLVAVRPQGNPRCMTQFLYPGLDGGLVSTRFRFETLMSNPNDGCKRGSPNVQVVAPQKDAQVTWMNTETFQSQSLNVPGGGAREIQVQQRGAPIEVESSAPVMLVQAGTGGRVGVQAPTAFGAPTGDTFRMPAYSSIRSVPWHNEVEVQAFDTQQPGDPQASLTEVGGPGPAEDAFFDMTSSDFADYRRDLWETSADGEKMSAYFGSTRGQIKGLTPLGGEEGRRFQVPFGDDERGDPSLVDEQRRLVLFPVYDQTHVNVTAHDAPSDGLDRTVNRHGFLDASQEGDDLFPGPGGYTVNASKPLLAYHVSSASKYAGFYPSVSRSPIYEVGDAEFHGHLIRWEETLRNPTMAPGQEKRFTLSLTNLGREIGGGNLPDDIQISQNVSRDWDVTLSSQQVRNLDSFESRDLTLAVSIPDSAETGQVLIVNLTAQSQGNPNFESFAQIKITIKTLFRVDMTFLETDCNPNSCERLVDAGSSTRYAVRVNNTGTGDDAYTFRLSESQSGFTGKLETRNGSVLATSGDEEPKDTLSIPRGEQGLMFLNVTAPDQSAGAFPYEAVVQAVSENDASARDQVVATTVLSVNTDFRLDVEDRSLPVTPGENATFQVRAVNEGADTVLDVSTSELSLQGWNVSVDPSSFLLRANGTVSPDGDRGDVRTVNVTVSAADDARVGEILPLEIQAVSKSGQSTAASEKAQVRATVQNNFTIATSGLNPRSLRPGETFRYEFSARNAANGPLEVGVNATGLPDGWRFRKATPVGSTSLDVGDTVDVAGDLVLPPGTPAGRYNVTFSFFAETPGGDRGVRNVTGLVQIGRQARLDVTPPQPVQPVPPGNRTRIPLNVTNAGNVEMTAGLTLGAPEGWDISFANRSQERLPLEPGDSRTVDVILGAPGEIGSGPVEWTLEADLPLRSPQEFRFEADWIERDLRVVELRSVTGSPEAGSTSVFAVTVRNDGDLPANNVDVALLADGEIVKNVTIETLPPGEDRVVRIPWTASDTPGSMAAVIDPRNDFVETDEENNRAGLTSTQASSVPGPGVAVAAATALAAAGLRRRWTR